MEKTSIEAAVSFEGRSLGLRLLLDSGQMYTCLPDWAWRELKVRPLRGQPLHRADGSVRKMRIGECSVRLELGEARTPVVLGEPGDVAILGTLTLAGLGYLLDPLSREIVPAAGRLGSVSVGQVKGLGRRKLPSEAGLVVHRRWGVR